MLDLGAALRALWNCVLGEDIVSSDFVFACIEWALVRVILLAFLGTLIYSSLGEKK